MLKLRKFPLFGPIYVKNNNLYIITLCICLEGIFPNNFLGFKLSKQINNKSFIHIYGNTLFGSFLTIFSVVDFLLEKKYTFCRGPSNEHSYQQEWCQLPQWSQKIIKI